MPFPPRSAMGAPTWLEDEHVPLDLSSEEAQMAEQDRLEALVSRAARSSGQERWGLELLGGEKVPAVEGGLKGKARSYAPRYREAQENFMERLSEFGIAVAFAPGPRGGRATGFFFAPEHACVETLEKAMERGCWSEAGPALVRRLPDGKRRRELVTKLLGSEEREVREAIIASLPASERPQGEGVPAVV